MQILVRMLANHSQDDNENDPLWRVVTVPQVEWDACENDFHRVEKVFYYGQNDFQPVDKCCSVSVGDVVFLSNAMYICRPLGFTAITVAELIELEEMDRRDRYFSEIVNDKPRLSKESVLANEAVTKALSSVANEAVAKALRS